MGMMIVEMEVMNIIVVRVKKEYLKMRIQKNRLLNDIPKYLKKEKKIVHMNVNT
jgi:hypothetical protein